MQPNRTRLRNAQGRAQPFTASQPYEFGYRSILGEYLGELLLERRGYTGPEQGAIGRSALTPSKCDASRKEVVRPNSLRTTCAKKLGLSPMSLNTQMGRSRTS